MKISGKRLLICFEKTPRSGVSIQIPIEIETQTKDMIDERQGFASLHLDPSSHWSFTASAMGVKLLQVKCSIW